MDELAQRVFDYDGVDLEEGLRLARDLVAGGRWDGDVARLVLRPISTYHGELGEQRLQEAVDAAQGRT